MSSSFSLSMALAILPAHISTALIVYSSKISMALMILPSSHVGSTNNVTAKSFPKKSKAKKHKRNIDWADTFIKVLKARKYDTCNTESIEKEHKILLEKISRHNNQSEVTDFILFGKIAINISKTMVEKANLTIYKDIIKKELFSVALHTKNLIEKSFTEQSKEIITNFFKKYGANFDETELIQLCFIVISTLVQETRLGGSTPRGFSKKNQQNLHIKL